MQSSSIEVDGIGTLSHEGLSRHWSGEVAVDSAADPIAITFDSTPEGPATQQLAAVRETLAQWSALLSEAVPGLGDLLDESELAGSDNPWNVFTVEGISVPALTYDPDGSVHVFIDLAHVDYPDEFLPAIDVVGGLVVEVLSGT